MEFTSKYPELCFYVNGEARRFSNGTYRTEDKDELEVLSKLVDVKAVKTIEDKVEAVKAVKEVKEPKTRKAVQK